MSSTTGNHENQSGRMVSMGTPVSRYLQIFVTAEMAFSVALVAVMSSFASGLWMAIVNSERASAVKIFEREKIER